jgi:hypothetical protein
VGIVDFRFEIADCRLKQGNYKSQNPNNKQITMTEIQNSKPSFYLKKENFKYVWVIEYWNLRFICDLVLEIWDFSFGIGR